MEILNGNVDVNATILCCKRTLLLLRLLSGLGSRASTMGMAMWVTMGTHRNGHPTRGSAMLDPNRTACSPGPDLGSGGNRLARQHFSNRLC